MRRSSSCGSFFRRSARSATITRKVSAPKKPKIVPADDDVKAALAEIADHPEITLSRREILRFILVEPTKRSEEIQTILKLDEIGQTRSALNTAQNKLQTAQRTAARAGAVQPGRPATASSDRDAARGGSAGGGQQAAEGARPAGNRGADRRYKARRRAFGCRQDAPSSTSNRHFAISRRFPMQRRDSRTSRRRRPPQSLPTSRNWRADPALLAALQRRSFIEKGLELVDGPECPLCDTPWEDEQHLRDHLKAKLAKSEEARKLQEALLKNGTAIAQEAIRVAGLLAPVQKLAEAQGDGRVRAASNALEGRPGRAEGQADDRGRTDRPEGPADSRLAGNAEGISERPEGSHREGRGQARPDGDSRRADIPDDRAAAPRRLPGGDAKEQGGGDRMEFRQGGLRQPTAAVLEEELNALYDEVQEDFSTFYRAINEDDEAKFTAKLTPSEGRLDLDVNFYERGLFPPAAYHSEGHQDGMGVCLYLALMKRLFGDRFTFALLDDVVMSVDAGHRYQFCKLLKTHFPDTQFIITTHDRLWAEQMKSAGLVTAKTSLAFHGWTIDTGPLVESNLEIWDEIAAALGKGKGRGRRRSTASSS